MKMLVLLEIRIYALHPTPHFTETHTGYKMVLYHVLKVLCDSKRYMILHKISSNLHVHACIYSFTFTCIQNTFSSCHPVMVWFLYYISDISKNLIMGWIGKFSWPSLHLPLKITRYPENIFFLSYIISSLKVCVCVYVLYFVQVNRTVTCALLFYTKFILKEVLKYNLASEGGQKNRHFLKCTHSPTF